MRYSVLQEEVARLDLKSVFYIFCIALLWSSEFTPPPPRPPPQIQAPPSTGHPSSVVAMVNIHPHVHTLVASSNKLNVKFSILLHNCTLLYSIYSTVFSIKWHPITSESWVILSYDHPPMPRCPDEWGLKVLTTLGVHMFRTLAACLVSTACQSCKLTNAHGKQASLLHCGLTLLLSESALPSPTWTRSWAMPLGACRPRVSIIHRRAAASGR